MKKIAYDQMYENEITHAWYVGTRTLMQSHLDNLIKKNAKILDLGCGTGGTIKFLQNNGYKNIYGVDSSKYAIQLCKKRGIKNIKLGNANKIPFKNSSFDAVICMDVLYHAGVDIEKTLIEIERILKKNAVFYSEEPAYYWLRSKHDLAIETKRRFTKKNLFQYFKNSKLKNIKNSYFNLIFFTPIALARIKDKILKTDKFDSDVKQLPSILNKLMLISLSFEIKILKYLSLPFGLSIISIWKK